MWRLCRRKHLVLLLGLALPILPACAAGVRAGDRGAVEREIIRDLEVSAERWNAGDLSGFLAPYHDSPGTTFVSSSGLVRGKDAIEARYRANYWKDGSPDETLRFVDIELRMLGADHALAVGRYNLFDAAGKKTGEGPFSLVLARTPQGWRIIHDHSS